MVNKLLQLKSITDGGLYRRSPHLLGIFRKNSYFNAIWITFRTFSEAFERTQFLRFESQLKKFLPLLQVKSKIRLKSCILGLNFATWPDQRKQGTLPSATFLALNNSLEDFASEFFVLSRELPLVGIHVRLWAQAPSIQILKFNNLFNMRFL